MNQYNLFDSDQTESLWDKPLFQNDISVITKITGLKHLPNFITAKEHDELLDAINNSSWLGDLKRRVQHYGWKYDYKAKNIDYTMFLGPLPLWAQPLAERLFKNGYINELPDQLIVNEYMPGQGIANHVDCEPCFTDTIISISLGSPCIMDFINLQTRDKLEIILAPRCLCVVQGEARYKWSHGIAGRLSDTIKDTKVERQKRISLTFRKVILKNKT